MTRQATTKERETQRAADKRKMKLIEAGQTLQRMRQMAQELMGQERLLRGPAQALFDQIDWLIAEDEVYAQAAAEMWAAAGRPGIVVGYDMRDEESRIERG